jgi:hypothetical protein
MRRPLIIATFVLLLASVPVVAQHGGGHAGGGHAGFGGGHMGGFSGHSGFSGGHVSGGMRVGSGPSRGFAHGPSFAQRSFTQRSFSQRGFQRRSFSNRPFLHDNFRRRHNRFNGFRNNCFGFGCGFYYPYAYNGFYDPYWWWDSGSYSHYDEDYERNRAEANEMNQQSLEEQRMRRQEEADGDQDSYNQDSHNQDSYARDSSARSAPAPHESAVDSPVPATVLVFRDQHQQEVRNYAIVGQTLWSFGPRTQKIPLADLDLIATTKANDDCGLTFRVPAPNEAQ